MDFLLFAGILPDPVVRNVVLTPESGFAGIKTIALRQRRPLFPLLAPRCLLYFLFRTISIIIIIASLFRWIARRDVRLRLYVFSKLEQQKMHAAKFILVAGLSILVVV